MVEGFFSSDFFLSVEESRDEALTQIGKPFGLSYINPQMDSP